MWSNYVRAWEKNESEQVAKLIPLTFFSRPFRLKGIGNIERNRLHEELNRRFKNRTI